MSTHPEPVRDDKGNWSVPPGYAHGQCEGCGHIFYDLRPVPKVDDLPEKIGLCHWCVDEGAV